MRCSERNALPWTLYDKPSCHDTKSSAAFCILEANQIFMGKGDKKSKKGKIIMGSFGVSRPHKKKQTEPETAPAKKKAKEPKSKKSK